MFYRRIREIENLDSKKNQEGLQQEGVGVGHHNEIYIIGENESFRNI